jgi:glucokinase
LAILVDILNPQRIIIGSIYLRQKELLEPMVMKVLKEEAISLSLSVCEVVPAGLGEKVGDFASLAVAMEGRE